MQNQDYHNSITVQSTPEEAFDKISHVSAWWARDFAGASAKPGDVFTVRFEGGDRYQVKVSEMAPPQNISWEVIDAYQGWHDDHTEWVGTTIVWEVLPTSDGTQVSMTHTGLVPAYECFDTCRQGWDYLIGKSLINLLNTNEGMPA